MIGRQIATLVKFVFGVMKVTLNTPACLGGRGQDAQLPQYIKAKIRMTFRQPAKDLDQWIPKAFAYQLRGLCSNSDPYGDASSTILGKRLFNNM